MQKPIVYLLVALLVVVLALIAIMRILNVVDDQQALDLGLKLTAILAVGLVASLLVGLLGKNTGGKK